MYLGFSFQGQLGTIQVAEKSILKFKRRMRELTGRIRDIRWSTVPVVCGAECKAGWVILNWHPIFVPFEVPTFPLAHLR